MGYGAIFDINIAWIGMTRELIPAAGIVSVLYPDGGTIPRQARQVTTASLHSSLLRTPQNPPPLTSDTTRKLHLTNDACSDGHRAFEAIMGSYNFNTPKYDLPLRV